MELTDKEQMAINEFIQQNWNKFQLVAKDFLDSTELERLMQKLEEDV